MCFVDLIRFSFLYFIYILFQYHVLLIESGFKLYGNSTLNLELLFPVLFGVPLTDLLDIVDELTNLLNIIPINADVSWLAGALDDLLSGYLLYSSLCIFI